MTADLRARRDLGQIVSDAWSFYRRYARVLLPVALIPFPLDMLTTVVVRRINDPTDAQLAGVYLQLLAALVGLVATAGLIAAMNDVAEGREPDAGHSVDVGLHKFWAVFTTGFIAAVHAILALFAVPFLALYWLLRRDATIDGRRDWYFALVPFALTIYLIVRWSQITSAVVIRDLRGWQALDHSAERVRGRWWRTLGILVAIGLISSPVVFLPSLTVYAPILADAVITAAAATLILPLATSAQTLLYYDLSTRQAADDHPA